MLSPKCRKKNKKVSYHQMRRNKLTVKLPFKLISRNVSLKTPRNNTKRFTASSMNKERRGCLTRR